MARLGLYTDREIFGAGLRWTLLPGHLLETRALEQLAADSYADDAVILDAPPEQTATLIRRLRSVETDGPRTDRPLIIWARVNGAEPALSALGMGAQGVMLDSSTVRDVLSCIDSVLNGQVWVPASIAQAVLSSRSCHLTPRESQLVTLVSQGLCNKEIASNLGISVGTVKVYFSRLFTKLGVSDRYELAMIGLRQAGTLHSKGTAGFSQTVFVPRVNCARILPATDLRRDYASARTRPLPLAR